MVFFFTFLERRIVYIVVAGSIFKIPYIIKNLVLIEVGTRVWFRVGLGLRFELGLRLGFQFRNNINLPIYFFY